MQADRRQTVTAGGREGADRLTKIDLLTHGHRRRHGLVGGPQLPVADRDDAAPGEQARIADHAGTGCSNRGTGRRSEVDTAMAGRPRLRGRVEPADDRGGFRQWKHPLRDGSFVGDGRLRQDDAPRDKHRDGHPAADPPAAGPPGTARIRPDAGPLLDLSGRGHGAIVPSPAARSGGRGGGLWTTSSDLAGLWMAVHPRLAVSERGDHPAPGTTRELAVIVVPPVHWPMAWIGSGHISRVPRTVTLSVPGSPGWVATRGARRGDHQDRRGQPDDALACRRRGRR